MNTRPFLFLINFQYLVKIFGNIHDDTVAHNLACKLADVIASFLYGCALQIVTDPTRFDTERTLATLDALVRQPVPA